MPPAAAVRREEPFAEPATEAEARQWLLKFCWKNNQRYCPRCLSRKNYRLGSGRRRCARCRYTFHDFTGRWINNCNLSPLEWAALLKLFADEATARQAAKALGLSYNTAYKAMSTIRFAILAHALDARQLLGEGSALGLTLPGRALGGGEEERPVGTPVFGIMDRREWVFVDLIPGFDIETLLHFKLNFHLGTVRLGNVVYTDKYQRYDTLICCAGNDPAADYFRGGDKPVAVDEAREGFWSFVSERLTKFHGVTPQRFPLYLKELEFRYNSRHREIMPMLAEYLCDLVPQPQPA
ncbi:transposase [Desulfocurvus sp. DL9XJH121]